MARARLDRGQPDGEASSTSGTAAFIRVAEWDGKTERLPAIDQLPATPHRYDDQSLHAINVALAAGRPLLVRGEPGTGKSQLARAAAHRLGRQYAWRVMDAQTKISDVFYDFDAVARLAQAQVVGALCAAKAVKPESAMDLLAERRFVTPGPLWWAFDAAGAGSWLGAAMSVEQRRRAADPRPYVVLIDEIDKTDPSVPNGLLEALGQGTFPVLRDKAVVSLHARGRPAPLVVITTNDERELPAAFVRRCLVLHIRVPAAKAELEAWLVERGRTHFPSLPKKLLAEAASLVHTDRVAAKELGLAPPGQAEYLDLLRAVTKLATGTAGRLALLGEIKDLALKKHPDLHGRGSSGEA